MLKKILVLLLILGLAFGVLTVTAGKTTFDVQNCRDLRASPGEVWQVLTDVSGWSQWWPGVTEARIEPQWQVGASLYQHLAGDTDPKPSLVSGVIPMMSLSWERPGVLGSTAGTRLELGTAVGGSSLCIVSSIVGPQAVLAQFTGREAFEKYHDKVFSEMGAYLVRGER